MVPRLQNDQIRISRKILRQFIGLTFILSQSLKFSFLRHSFYLKLILIRTLQQPHITQV